MGLIVLGIGIITDTMNVEVKWNGEILANIPSKSLVLGGDAPQYEMPYKTAEYL